ncbi:MAG: HisA/HisF-related TIM barrel protein, partial [Candidatus Bathyarchaeota archaeon]
EIVRQMNIPVEVGGGIRTPKDATFFIEAGANWVIVGTSIIEKPVFLNEIMKKVDPKQIIIAIDSRNNRILTRGWIQKTEQSPKIALKMFQDCNIAAFLYTDVAVEGMMQGINLSNVTKLIDATEIPIIYAGGISSLSDVKSLAKIGAKGAVIGRAFYDASFTLREAEEAMKNASRDN